jgi:C4-dicarboxylate-specific signal transduction histidine kinase
MKSVMSDFKKLNTKIFGYFIIFVFIPLALFNLLVYYLIEGILSEESSNLLRIEEETVSSFRHEILVAGLIVGIVIIISAVLVSRRITHPLNVLTGSARRIRQGDLDHKISLKSNDEFQLLARELELMRLKLLESYQSLEGKIDQRTRELKEAQAQIIHQEKMASLGLMAAGIAHEIGNPLTSISSIAQVIKRKNLDEQIGKYINDILKNIDRITRIVRELIDFSRPSSYQPAQTNINDIIKSAVGIIKYDRRAKDLAIDLSLEERLPETVVVSDQLLQVFLNILINALDAAEDRGDQIQVSSKVRKNKIFVTIRDNGCGIPADNLHRIFEPFFTTKEVGRGTGLGLTVSYGIIQQLGGEIKVTSKVNQGSAFEISIPVLTQEEQKQ